MIINHGKIVIRYTPVLSFFDMWIHVGLLLLGYNVVAADLIFSLPLLYGLAFYCGCVAYGYCKLHRALTLYTIAVSFCINYQQSLGFGMLLMPLRWLMFIIGCGLFVWLCKNRFCV